jgi:hypothetical protein
MQPVEEEHCMLEQEDNSEEYTLGLVVAERMCFQDQGSRGMDLEHMELA